MSEFAQGPGSEQAVRDPAQETHPAGPAEEPAPDSGHSPAADPGHGPHPESGPGSAPESDGGPAPLEVGVRPTGHGPVDAELRRLEDADHLAVSGHLEVYEDVHRGLRETLAALDRPHTPRS